jgi:C_GCAxxG_C_C family probable redox protein
VREVIILYEDDTAERARQHFLSGFNCAESVLLAVTEELGTEAGCVPRIATGFGSGIALAGQVCGAVTGAVMAAGMLLGRDSPVEASDRLYELCGRFMEDFSDVQGSITCRELTGVDLADQAERKRARESGLFQHTCTPLVAYSARWMASALGCPH